MPFDVLRRGDLVEVKAPAEILETLDERGTVDGVPFMPEMASYCGRRFKVDRRADKVCDTIKYTGSRRVRDTVLLADLRCAGTGHGGCQAECRLLWKEVWLRRVAAADADASGMASAVSGSAVQVTAEDLRPLVELVTSFVKRNAQPDGQGEERWMCQATSLYEASEHLRVWDPRPYIEQYTNGDTSLGHCLRITARATLEEPLRKMGLTPRVPVPGTATEPYVGERLDLQPGEWVQVRSKEEIAATLTPDGYNRGMWFDREMLAYCGGTFRVRQRISRFIDDFRDHGKLVTLKSDAVTLDEVVCSGELSQRRWFCPRRIYSYWRDCWLRRVDAPAAS